MRFRKVDFKAERLKIGKTICNERKEKMTEIRNGRIGEFLDWYDEDGNVINASDGGIIYVDGVYHWYGMAFRNRPFAGNGEGGQATTTGVVMYASQDLYHWKYEGVILACSENPEDELYGPMRFEK